MRFLALIAAAVAICGGAAASTGPTTFAVYLVHGEHLAPVRRVVPHNRAVARAALDALLAGPTAAERRAGYLSAVPTHTTLRGVSIAHGVATVDLGRRFESGGGSLSMLLRVAQVVYTATQFPTVGRVSFRLDGRPVEAIGGEGVMVAPPVARATFAGQAPRILVEQPLPGDHVSGTLVVRGTADVFEQQFLVDVTTPSGRVVAHRAVTATSGTFSIRIPLAVRAANLVVVAYDRSAKTGARIDVVRIPFTKD